MRARCFLSFLLLCSCLVTSAALAGSVEVVSTAPAHMETGVSPLLTEVRVTFSVPMRQDSWSFVLDNEKNFPAISGDPYFEDDYTCVLPVVLEPETEYSMLINGGNYWNFVSQEGQDPADSYTLTFTTGPAQ